MQHYAKECRASIEIITPEMAQCPICGQTYKRTNYYGKVGWQKQGDDNRLYEYIMGRKGKKGEDDEE